MCDSPESLAGARESDHWHWHHALVQTRRTFKFLEWPACEYVRVELRILWAPGHMASREWASESGEPRAGTHRRQRHQWERRGFLREAFSVRAALCPVTACLVGGTGTAVTERGICARFMFCKKKKLKISQKKNTKTSEKNTEFVFFSRIQPKKKQRICFFSQIQPKKNNEFVFFHKFSQKKTHNPSK